MFQLIVGVIAIFLIAALASAAIWYGGSIHTDSKIKADYVGNMNTATQIQGALELYFNDHSTYPPSGLTDAALLEFLVAEKYLKEVPNGDWMVNPGSLSRLIDNQDVEVCRNMNRVAGFDVTASDLASYDGCPPCTGAEATPEGTLAQKYRSWPVCQAGGT